MILDKYATIERLTQTVGNVNKEDYQAVSGLEKVLINVQPANPEDTVLVNGIFGNTYTCFLTNSGIKEGDRLTVSGLFVDGITLNKKLQVSSVANWWFGPLPHFEITCTDIK